MIIYWQRSNLLRAFVSNEIAKKTKVWYGIKEQPNLHEKKVVVNPKTCKSWIERVILQQKISEYVFRHHFSYTASYENFLFDNNKIIELLRFLDVDPNQKLFTKIERQNPEPLDQLIVNFEELKNAFRNTPWFVFINDIGSA